MDWYCPVSKKGKAIKGGRCIWGLLGRAAGRLAVTVLFVLPKPAWAIQLHQGSEGIIVHQVGHLFFLLSMVVLVFIITGRQLNRKRGWRMIQYSAILFVLWNLDTVLAHFLDNQIHAVTVKHLSLWQLSITAESGSPFLAYLYHTLKLDHLLCVPAIFFFYRGLSSLLAQESHIRRTRDQAVELKAGRVPPAFPDEDPVAPFDKGPDGVEKAGLS